MATKLLSVSSTGRIRKTTAVKQSTFSRTNQLLDELGISKDEFKTQSSLRMYTRMATNKYLGINS